MSRSKVVSRNIDEMGEDVPRDEYGFPVLPKPPAPRPGESEAAEDEAPVQRMIGGYVAIYGMPGWYTREITLRQEIELADMAGELESLEGAKPSRILKIAIPIAMLLIFHRNADGDMIAATEDDLLDKFRASTLLKIVQSVTGFASGGESENPTAALPTTD